MGKISPKSIGGAQYVFTLIDDFSRFVTVYFLTNKDHVFRNFVDFKNKVELQHGTKIKSIQTDNGGEYVNNEFRDFLKANGIIHRRTVPRCPEQNGVAERQNRTLAEMSRCLLLQSGMPEQFWAEAVNTACYLRNLCVNSSINNQIPIVLWKGDSVDLKLIFSKLRVFGCRVWAFIEKEKRSSKFGAVAEECVFVGYGECNYVKGFKLWNLSTRKVQFRHHVIFDENVFPFLLDCDTECDIFKDVLEPFKFRDEINLDDVDFNSVEYEQIETPTVIEDRVVETQDDNFVEVETPHDENSFVVEPNIGLRRSARKPVPKICSCCNLAVAKCELKDFDDNINVCEALNGPDKDKWLDAMKNEIQSLHDQNVWDVVQRPSGKHVIDCKWILRIKRNVDGTVNKFKARLVARGFSQIPGLDYSEISSPVVKRRTWRFLIAICVENNWLCNFIDVQGAYLNSKLNEELYMHQPAFFQERGKNFVCKLNKSLYGLKQGGRDWHNHINQIMCKFNFSRCSGDNCVYVHPSKELFVSWYVDDACVCGVPDRVNWFIECLSSMLEIRNLGSNSQYLSIDVCQNVDDKSISLSQSHYISQILEYYMMSDSKGVFAPLEKSGKPDKNINVQRKFDPTTYQQGVGTLLYLSNNTRPDLSFAVSKLAQKNQCPTVSDWNNFKHVLRYLVTTKHYKLVYRKSGEAIQVYCDADFAGDISDRKSRCGYVIKLACCPVSWFSKKQNCVALSTVESEYIAMCEVAKEVLWLKQLLLELGQNKFIESPCIVNCDNQGAIGMSKKIDENMSERSKHISVRYHFCKELQSEGVVKFVYVESSNNIADIFTKALGDEETEFFCRQLGFNV